MLQIATKLAHQIKKSTQLLNINVHMSFKKKGIYLSKNKAKHYVFVINKNLP